MRRDADDLALVDVVAQFHLQHAAVAAVTEAEEPFEGILLAPAVAVEIDPIVE